MARAWAHFSSKNCSPLLRYNDNTPKAHRFHAESGPAALFELRAMDSSENDGGRYAPFGDGPLQRRRVKITVAAFPNERPE